MNFEPSVFLFPVVEEVRHNRFVVLKVLAERNRYRLASSVMSQAVGVLSPVVEISRLDVTISELILEDDDDRDEAPADASTTS